MDWAQFITFIVTIVGLIFLIRREHMEDMQGVEKKLELMDKNHREDIQLMDSKWERLFERLLLQDQSRS